MELGLLAALQVYFLIGAATGHLVLPSRHGDGYYQLAGAYAWLACVTPALLGAGVIVYRGGIQALSRLQRQIVSIALWVAAFALLFFCLLHSHTEG
ncbi:MAG TPA: hypothetical protein VFW84_05520 [Aquabacterium sp.]|uniref:hypothetical protein n=1 Tax=Aquabacterium sp. TaxID=1872578 RepID=UPI002E3801FD|nr:hypothetical protein [Aquabacterium sp.]HEX5372173.1 hypothetical protein [Aquabacterium sp.]